MIASGDGFSANTEDQALNNAVVTQNARMRTISGRVVSSIVDADGNILIDLQAVKDYPSLASKQIVHDKSALNEG